MSDWHKDLSRVPEEGPLATLGEHAPAPKGRVRRQVEADEVKRTLPAPRDSEVLPLKAASKTADDERPTIRVKLGELPAAVAKSNQLLAKHSGAMFVLGDLLVTIENVDTRLQTVPVTQARIGLELARVARFEKIGRVTETGPEWIACDPPLKLAAAIADEPGGWRSPVLTGLTEVPILRSDGSIKSSPGYDPESRLYLHGARSAAPLFHSPRAALDLLLDALREFPFVKPHHRSAALALLITSVIRRQLPSSPMFGISAREAGTGKGVLASLAAIMTTGRRAPETPWPSHTDEQRKVITSVLIGGQPLIILDNISDVLDSPPLCVLLTAETWSDRVLGQSRQLQLPASVLVVATGNNLRIAGDLCRRVLPIEMDAGCENPELRKFERELLTWAISNRAQLVAAVLTILSSYRSAGEPVPNGFVPLGSFEKWCRTVCGALIWIGEPDPRDAMAATRANDPKRQLLGNVLSGMETLFGLINEASKAPWQSTTSLFEAATNAGPDRAPGLLESLEVITTKARDDKASRIMLGRWLEVHKGRVVGGLRLEGTRDEHCKVNLWGVKCCG